MISKVKNKCTSLGACCNNVNCTRWQKDHETTFCSAQMRNIHFCVRSGRNKNIEKKRKKREPYTFPKCLINY